MAENLLHESWADQDSHELRLLLDQYIGGPGQYDRTEGDPDRFYLPLARNSCIISLTFKRGEIATIEAGPAFDDSAWARISAQIDESLLGGQMRVGRDFSFSSYRVNGSWRGKKSGLQILAPPTDTPRAPVEIAEHPFILEFPLRDSGLGPLTNHRRRSRHAKLTLLLHVLLAGRTNFFPRSPEHVWANIAPRGELPSSAWVQRYFSGSLDALVLDELSPPDDQRLEELEPEQYWATVGHDGRGLRVPTDLDESICLYFDLTPPNRAKFDRASFWLNMSSRQWTVSVSSAFASLVTAIESLTDRGATHWVFCKDCNDQAQHEVPGATERFRSFLEKFSPDTALKDRRSEMYRLRSGILHGSKLMQMDQDLAFGWDPPGWNERELHWDLVALTKTALRNWLKSHSQE